MRKNYIKIKRSYTKGFTLVELLIAISILSLAILATFTAISNNLRGSNFAEDQMIAYYLADEGIEYIRNLRDQNTIKNGGVSPVQWLAGFADTSADSCYGNDGKVCYIDAFKNEITACTGSASTCPNLYTDINPADTAFGLYGYTSFPATSWKQTQFRRSISINVISTREAVVSSTVSWTTNGVSKNYTLSENLLAWQ